LANATVLGPGLQALVPTQGNAQPAAGCTQGAEIAGLGPRAGSRDVLCQNLLKGLPSGRKWRIQGLEAALPLGPGAGKSGAPVPGFSRAQAGYPPHVGSEGGIVAVAVHDLDVDAGNAVEGGRRRYAIAGVAQGNTWQLLARVCGQYPGSSLSRWADIPAAALASGNLRQKRNAQLPGVSGTQCCPNLPCGVRRYAVDLLPRVVANGIGPLRGAGLGRVCVWFKSHGCGILTTICRTFNLVQAIPARKVAIGKLAAP